MEYYDSLPGAQRATAKAYETLLNKLTSDGGPAQSDSCFVIPSVEQSKLLTSMGNAMVEIFDYYLKEN